MRVTGAGASRRTASPQASLAVLVNPSDPPLQGPFPYGDDVAWADGLGVHTAPRVA